MGFRENGILGKWDFGIMEFWEKWNFGKMRFWKMGVLENGSLGIRKFEKMV